MAVVELLTRDAPELSEHDLAEALFEEARQRQRRRRVRVALLGLMGILIGLGVYAVLAVGAHSSNAGSARSSASGVVLGRTKVVVLLVDVSGSMAATDIQPTRLSATVKAIRVFLDQVSPQVRVGLIAFSTNAELRVRPTLNREPLLASLAALQPEKGTALGDGLTAAVNLSVSTLAHEGIKPRSGHFLPATIVLVSDGAQNNGAVQPLAAAKHAETVGVRVDGVAVGTKDGSVTFGAGGGANHIAVPPDPQDVRAIAGRTHGDTSIATSSAILDSAFLRFASTINK